MTTYDASTEDAWRAASAYFPGLGERALIEDASGGCTAQLTKVVAVRVCTANGHVGQLTVTARTTEADLAKGIAAVTTVVSPETEPAELARVNAEAKSALAEGNWRTVCPDIRCFKVFPSGGGWQIIADAGAV